MSDLDELPGQLMELRALIRAAHESRQDLEVMLARQRQQEKDFEKNLLAELTGAHSKAEKKLTALIADMGARERDALTEMIRAGQVPTFEETGNMITDATVIASKINSDAMLKLTETMYEKFEAVMDSLHVVSEHQATYGAMYEKLERNVKSQQRRLDKLIANLGGTD